MKNDVMADRNVGADDGRHPDIGVDDGIVLYVRVLPDLDPFVVAPEHGAEPDARVSPEAHAADNAGSGRDPEFIFVRKFGFGIAQRPDPHFRELLRIIGRRHSAHFARAGASLLRSKEILSPSPRISSHKHEIALPLVISTESRSRGTMDIWRRSTFSKRPAPRRHTGVIFARFLSST